MKIKNNIYTCVYTPVQLILERETAVFMSFTLHIIKWQFSYEY